MESEAARILEEFGPALARLAAGYERNRALREELVQEIALAVFQALPRLADPAKLKPFVFRIAHNRAVSHVVRRAREPRGEELGEHLSADAPSPEQSLLERERSGRLVAAVRALPLPYRQVVMLVLEGLSHAEIAEALGLSLSNVGVRVNRAKERLKELLDD
ncbi:MAG: sigma-70 family RNA polymerase sigma factor [Alphaproteobacteria bacterium]